MVIDVLLAGVAVADFEAALGWLGSPAFSGQLNCGHFMLRRGG
jgi:hypothetical protein